MKIIIIEDEKQAALRLQSILKKINIDTNILAILASIKESINWFKKNEKPDLIFLDIQLSDGSSFEIFKNVEINIPIVFVTAFNQYIIESFKLNNLDYIVKPYSQDDIYQAIVKYNKIHGNIKKENYQILYNKLSENIKKNYKTRFFTRINKKIYTVNVEDILYLLFEDNATVLVDKNSKIFVINYSLEKLENLLNPKLFFRINRKIIINIKSIKNINILSKSRIEVILIDKKREIVSRAKSSIFKTWLDY